VKGRDVVTAFRTPLAAGVCFDLEATGVSARIWYVFVFVMVVAVSVAGGAESRKEDPPGGPGAKIYHEKCAGCHGDKGQGVPGLFPPLAGDSVVTATDPRDQIRTVLFGKQGVAIGGVAYAVTMPSWAGQLSDQEVAAVINHERTSWGNSAPTVTPAAVEKIRSEGPP
jgi:cytochrome c oxidase cbb3-type subunit 2